MTPSIKNKKILIIDDDSDILDVMQEALTYEGYEVNSLQNTSDIFTELNHYQPDLILLDYILQGINGGELCHLIKSNQQTSGIPVMMMSAYPRVLKSLGDYGCDAFMAKPFNLEELSGTVFKLTANK